MLWPASERICTEPPLTSSEAWRVASTAVKRHEVVGLDFRLELLLVHRWCQLARHILQFDSFCSTWIAEHRLACSAVREYVLGKMFVFPIDTIHFLLESSWPHLPEREPSILLEYLLLYYAMVVHIATVSPLKTRVSDGLLASLVCISTQLLEILVLIWLLWALDLIYFL